MMASDNLPADICPSGFPVLSQGDFDLFRELILENCGISVSANKLVLLQNRIGKRLRALGYNSFGDYYKYAVTPIGRRNELIHLWSAITTNVTHFFREPHHFEALTTCALPQIMENKRTGTRINVWSAGCSTGQEVYTLAMVLQDFFSKISKTGFKVSGTDIDINALSIAERGVYPKEMKKDIPAKYLLPNFDLNGETITVKPHLRRQVEFRQQNLRELSGSHRKYDLIFCRNVVMYFDRGFRAELLKFFYRSLTENGFLFFGSSESINGMPRLFKVIKSNRALFYQKLPARESEI